MIKGMLRELLLIIDNNRGKFLGGIFGFLIGIMVIILGFFKTLFIIICTFIGWLIGGQSYTKEEIKDWLERNLPPGGIR